jgi:putative DNA primase/helicase
MAAVYPENIPQDLRSVDNWVVWRLEERDGKLTKPPWRADGSGHASATDPATWTTFERAYQAYLTGDYDGVGVVMTEDMGIVGVDLDKVDGWSVEAGRILATLDSYTEITPSQNGYRVYVKGAMPPGARRKGHVELYSDKRFFTVTGDTISRDTVIQERTTELAAVHAEWLGRSVTRPFGPIGQLDRATQPVSKLSLADSALVQLAMAASNGARFTELWNGGGDDHSGSDLALCNMLAFWWGPDASTVDRVFRLSGLMRDKWDSARGDSTYGAWTVARALEDATERYEPGSGQVLMTANRGAEAPEITTGEEHEAPVEAYSIHNAFALLDVVIPEARFAVTGLITEGLNLFAGKPKMGKSWVALGIGLAISAGSEALGSIGCESGDVLYLALEDSPRRLQSRLRLLGAAYGAARLTLVSAPGKGNKPFPRANVGGLQWIEGWLESHPDARLVIIDTLAMFRSPRSKNGDIYLEDYAAASEIKQLADSFSVAFLVVHHLNKGADGDFVQAVSGSTGITGAADGILVMERERNNTFAVLKVTGRDIEEKEYPLREASVGRWETTEAAEEPEAKSLRMDILDVMRLHTRPLFASDVAKQLGISGGTVRQRMWRMGQEGIIKQMMGGGYALLEWAGPQEVGHGSHGKRHPDNGITNNGQEPTNLSRNNITLPVIRYNSVPLDLPDGSPVGSNGVAN